MVEYRYKYPKSALKYRFLHKMSEKKQNCQFYSLQTFVVKKRVLVISELVLSWNWGGTVCHDLGSD